jgi:hypothetical protein
MKAIRLLTLAGAVALTAALVVPSARAGLAARQYYSGWRHSSQGYWFSTHYYKPYADYPSYCTNYCIYYPGAPKFVFYFNPYRGTYWGRFNVQTKGYSLLAEKDRAGRLKAIPEKAFPKEGELPPVPDSKDKVQLEEPPDLPIGEAIGKDDGTAQAGAATPGASASNPNPPGKPTDPKPGPGAAPDKSPPAPTPDTGVVAPAEPVNPRPAPGPATPVNGGAGAPGGLPPREDLGNPFSPPGNCPPPPGGCAGHRYGW